MLKADEIYEFLFCFIEGQGSQGSSLKEGVGVSRVRRPEKRETIIEYFNKPFEYKKKINQYHKVARKIKFYLEGWLYASPEKWSVNNSTKDYFWFTLVKKKTAFDH